MMELPPSTAVPQQATALSTKQHFLAGFDTVCADPMKSFFFVLGTALATKPATLLMVDKEGGTARASFSYTAAGGLAIETNGCVDRSSW